ncbi:DUF4124 domain-containing protein [Pseudomonas sp. RIT-PI-S]|uniref:DUF4124 domain-containing protein n=1 Tax=Pseudomonas sp. RIT-PI-S TaxID=3035295 RepID=UPI0021DB22DC|nr:DUF4124 domain-containing protein [Pseudomonas sp. RIT-PI-S]
MRPLLLAMLLCLSGLCQAQVYTYVDAQGNRVYTDQPRKGAKSVQVPEGNRINLSPASTQNTPQAKPKPKPKAPAVHRVTHYEMFRILVPLPDAGVSHASGELIVTLTSDPALAEGDVYRVLLDGQPFGEPGPSPVVALQNVDRGTHQLAAEILDSQGNVIERTPSQPVHMQRISLAQKRRVHPCKKADYGVRPECPIGDKPPDDDDDDE